MYKSLKEICREIGVSRRAVQGYEELGMVSSSQRNKYGHLLYSETTVESIQKIKQYQDYGFSLKEIRILLNANKEEYVEMMSLRLEELQQEKNVLEIYIQQIKSLLSES